MLRDLTPAATAKLVICVLPMRHSPINQVRKRHNYLAWLLLIAQSRSPSVLAAIQEFMRMAARKPSIVRTWLWGLRIKARLEEPSSEARLMDAVDNRGPPAPASCGAVELGAAQFAQLLDRNSKRVHAYISNRVRDRDIAIELFHESLSNAWAGRSTFDARQDELAWLIAVARNVVADYLKKITAQKRQPESGQLVPRGDGRFPTGPSLETATKSAVDPASEMIHEEAILALDEAIDRLDTSKSKAIELRRAGLSYEDIAARMGISNGTVGSLLSRATTELRKMLATHTD